MVDKLPVLSGRAAVRIFQTFGWHEKRQVGSHIKMTKAGLPVTLSVPNHREVAKGTPRALLSIAGINVTEFVRMSKKI